MGSQSQYVTQAPADVGAANMIPAASAAANTTLFICSLISLKLSTATTSPQDAWETLMGPRSTCCKKGVNRSQTATSLREKRRVARMSATAATTTTTARLPGSS